MKKRLMSLLLAVCIVLQMCGNMAFATEAEDVIAQGSCGDALTWTLTNDYVLIISGEGVMVNDGYEGGIPWYDYRELITAVIIEDGVTAIAPYAFYYNYEKLKTIKIGKDVGAIAANAFNGCEVLEAFIISSENSTYAVDADGVLFDQVNDILLCCPAAGELTDYTVPAGTKEISARAFYECENLQSITIPGSVTAIGDSAFYYCDNLAAVQLSDGLTSIGRDAFYNCKKLASINLPESVNTIGQAAFSSCAALTEIIIPDSVSKLEMQTFIWCGSLEKVTVGSGVQLIDSNAFSYCTALKEVTFRGNAPSIYLDEAGWHSAFKNVTATCYYPADNDTWTADIMQNYGGTLTWEAREIVADKDTAVPVLTIDAPEVNSRVWSVIELTVSAADQDDQVTVNVGYAVGGEDRLTSVSPGTGGIYVIDLSNLTAADDSKSLSITVTAQDSSENMTSEMLSYVIDNVPEPVADLTAAAREDNVYLSWTVSEPDDNVQSYCLLRDGSDGTSIRVELDKTASAYNDTAVEHGVTYFYKVVAQGYTGLGQESAEVECTYKPDTTAPVIHEIWPATEDEVTFCHDGTLQVAASDETALDRAEVYANGALIGSAGFDDSGLSAIEWDCADLSGAVTLTYKVYDTAGNSAEASANVTIRRYTAPVTPTNLTVENGFRSATLHWEYTGDLATLKQFNIYDGDPDGGMLVTTVRDYKYTFRDLSEEATFVVAAVDIYGQQSFNSEIITVTPILTESEKPVARLQAGELTAVTGTEITLSGAGSTDNDKIASYAWDFGDGTTAEGIHATHTYSQGGTYTVTLTVTDRCGNTDTATCTVTVYDTLGADATHAMLTVTVMDGYTAGTPAIENATVTVYSEGFEAVALTDNAGHATLVVPKGTHTMTVVKEGFDGRMGEIEVTPDESGSAAKTIYLAAAGVSIVDGDLTVTPMTREEMEEVGIDPDDPANNHVVKQQTTIRFQPMPEVAFDIPVEQIFDALGNLIPDKSSGFGWHTFTPVSDDSDDDEDDKEEDDDNDRVPVEDIWPTKPKYDVGVFPVGDSAYMVIYGQSHWLKEMFNVELIVYNNSYAQDITDCVAELNLPEGLSLAAMLEGEQTEQVYIGQIDYIGKTDGMPTRQVNWYVRGDAEGDYNLTAAVDGFVGGDRFHTDFTTSDPIHVYAGSALLLTVTMPKSAYAEKEYAVKFSLNNVSDKPIYNLTFGIDTAQQFVAERMSDGSTGEVEREYSNEDFEGGMTYGLPTLEPGKAFNLVLKTTFAYEHQFVEWAVGRIPLDVAEVGYQVADCFVTTLEGSTTEIPVEIILEDVKKDNIFQWIWDSTIGALKENTKETIIELVDDKVFQGAPVIEKGVEIIEVVTNIGEELEETEIEYIPTVNVTDGVQCVPQNEVDDWLSAFDTYSLRCSALPGMIVWTDAVDAEISEDGKTMQLPSGGKLYILRLGETAETPEIAVTTYYVDVDGAVQPFTQTLTAVEGLDENGAAIGGTYIPGLQNAKHILLNTLTETSFEIPEAGETLTVPFDGWLITENGDILLRAANERWTIEGENTDGLAIVDGRLVIDSTAKAGTYTVCLTLAGTDKTFEQTITLTGGIPTEGPTAVYSTTADGDSVTVALSGQLPDEACTVFAAANHADGRMIGIGQIALNDRVMTIVLPGAGDAAKIGVFVLNGISQPMTPIYMK